MLIEAFILRNRNGNRFYAIHPITGGRYETYRLKEAKIFNNENDATEHLLSNQDTVFLKDYFVFAIMLQPPS
ncbi:MAG: hypothetical protein [Bacteriophage sp.]|nr:MAG: hypothetical protein [Bacteriophage sp.]